ncbi:hypothetical protein TWF730_008475 [Orbilia blumenaviensis]|uniref:Tetrapyrrole methylase domain-containing protein n=1 Tax=Orbilia blumenaviensis TaxID=1796055 RepID=A0AAV9V5N6_9PEZI
MAKTGSLILVGTGVKSLCQLTLEAIQELERADIIYYAVRDATLEGFIKKKNHRAVDLYQYFINDEQIPESDLYIQISEVILGDVRKGLYVVGAFFGHPGLFMSSNRRALAIAQAEGYMAKMLPGISVDDCLLADLGIDPSFVGCLTCEAWDFLIHDHVGLLSRHVIMYEIGYLKPSGKSIKIDYYQILVAKLQEIYGDLHPLVNYTAATSPLMQPVIEHFTVGDLFKPDIRKRVTSASTLYFPPKDALQLNKFANQLLDQGVITKEQLQHAMFPGRPLYQLAGGALPPEAYSDHAQRVVATLTDHKASPRCPVYRASSTMQATLEEIYLKSQLREKYLISPASFAELLDSSLEDTERMALASGNYVEIEAAMKSGDLDEAIRK